MDAFFAAVEQRDNPELKGKPVIVGGPPNSRGVVATCSYEARQYGIHSAMPSSRASKLCPHGIFVKPRFHAYKTASNQIHEIFNQYTNIIEPLSLDEAYLDVTEVDLCQGSATLIAKDIRQKIFKETKLTASAGVSYNKFLAKVASDINKPNGQFVIKPEDGERFVASLPIGKFYGIGRVTEAKMHALGIQTGADLKAWPLEKMQQVFGKSAGYFYSIARGVDERPVGVHRERKSLGSEHTFQKDISDTNEMQAYLELLAEEVLGNLRQKDLLAHTITLKVKYADFQQITRSKTFEGPVHDLDLIKQVIPVLLHDTEIEDKPVRLLGFSCSNFIKNQAYNECVQLELFTD